MKPKAPARQGLKPPPSGGGAVTRISEAQLQRQIVDYLNVALLPTHLVFAIPNAAPRMVGARASNAVAGLRKGMTDLAIVGAGRVYFVEVKTDKGVLSAEQEDFKDWCLMKGMCGWCCARSLDDVRAALRHWGIETREARQ
jgi:hypothetical protein